MSKKQIRCLISAGPTREFFDPVRFISNPSSGKMGYAIAKCAVERNWQTTLVLGPSSLPKLENANTINVVSALDMLEALQNNFDNCDVLIMTAAVSDFRPKYYLENKVKKNNIQTNIEFVQNPDILKTLTKNKGDKICIGFAAETNDVIAYAKNKLVEKNLDAIVCNDVSDKQIGFNSDINKVDVILKTGEIIALDTNTKDNLANSLLDIIQIFWRL